MFTTATKMTPKVSKQIELPLEDLGWFRPIIEAAKEMKATDINVVEGRPPRIGILKNYKILQIGEDNGGEKSLFKPTKSHIEHFIDKTLSPELMDMSFLLDPSDLVPQLNSRAAFPPTFFEYGFSVTQYGRYRVSCTTSEEGLGLALRKLPYSIPTLGELDRFNFLDGIKKMLNFQNRPPGGLILHTGVTGSGKSTTIASEIDYIASRISGNILIFENPIEYQITLSEATVRHYEINRHIRTFEDATRLAMRNDPSVIMIGEVRGPQEVRQLFEMANKGHMVFSTLHTSNVMNTIRYLDKVGAQDPGSWRQDLAGSLLAIVSQKLLYRNDEYCLLAEVFIPNAAARSKIAEGNLTELSTMFYGNQLKENGSITYKSAFDALVAKNVIGERERREYGAE